MGVINALQTFTLPYTLTNGEGTPVNSLTFYVMHLYNNAFGYMRMGYASAMAWILFLIILILTIVILVLLKNGYIIRNRRDFIMKHLKKLPIHLILIGIGFFLSAPVYLDKLSTALKTDQQVLINPPIWIPRPVSGRILLRLLTIFPSFGIWEILP